MKQPNYIVFDTETGGLNSKKNPMTEFAGIIVESETLKEISRWKTYIQPYNDLKIENKALEMTNLTMAIINKGMKINDFVDKVIKFIKAANPTGRARTRPVLVGHNVSFDIAFMDEAFRLSGKDFRDYVQTNNGIYVYYDTLQKARLFWRNLSSKENQSHTLTSCCERAGITLIDAHGAMQDTNATFELFEFFTINTSTNGRGTIKKRTTKQQKSRNFFNF